MKSRRGGGEGGGRWEAEEERGSARRGMLRRRMRAGRIWCRRSWVECIGRRGRSEQGGASMGNTGTRATWGRPGGGRFPLALNSSSFSSSSSSLSSSLFSSSSSLSLSSASPLSSPFIAPSSCIALTINSAVFQDCEADSLYTLEKVVFGKCAWSSCVSHASVQLNLNQFRWDAISRLNIKSVLLCWYPYMYTVYTYIYTRHIYIYICIYAYMYVYICIHTCIYTYVEYTYMYTRSMFLHVSYMHARVYRFFWEARVETSRKKLPQCARRSRAAAPIFECALQFKRNVDSMRKRAFTLFPQIEFMQCFRRPQRERSGVASFP